MLTVMEIFVKFLLYSYVCGGVLSPSIFILNLYAYCVVYNTYVFSAPKRALFVFIQPELTLDSSDGRGDRTGSYDILSDSCHSRFGSGDAA